MNENHFFEKHIGANCERRAEVFTWGDGLVRLDTNSDTEAPTATLTPQQAKTMGRALIKAAKFAEKKTPS